MNSQCFTYIIKKGDTLYSLARTYGTSVTALLAKNPGIDPYNLMINSELLICPDVSTVCRPPNCLPQISFKQMALKNNMRLLWEQHVYWTRMFLISTAERLQDQNDTAARLLKNPGDIAALFAVVYPENAAKLLEDLLTEHLQIGGEVITALRDGKKTEADALDKKWFENADKMADAFASVNPYYGREELRKMLYRHLDLTTAEVAKRLEKNYPADIEAFAKVEDEALMMADYFSAGLLKQFPQVFN